MNQFQVSPIKRTFSRIYFYAGLVLIGWVVENATPTTRDLDIQRDLELGVAIPFFGVSVEDMKKYPELLNR